MDTQALKAKIVALLEENSYSIATLEKVIDLLQGSELTYEDDDFQANNPLFASEPEAVYGEEVEELDEEVEMKLLQEMLERSRADLKAGRYSTHEEFFKELREERGLL